MNIENKLIFLYNKNPYFNINFYKNFYDEFKNYTNEQIINHYIEYGLNEDRLTCKKDFYDLFKKFTIENYRFFNSDLSHIKNEIELMKHYHNYGVFENRIISKNDFFDKNNDFDINFYKLFYEYNNNTSDENIIINYLNNKNNNIYISKEIFYKNYPLFELYIYKYLNNDLETLNEIELLRHYHNFGFIEQRKCSTDDFFDLYKNFDFAIYKKFQKNNDSFSYIEIIIYYLKSIYNRQYNIASLEDFFKKYIYFNIDLYKTFNNINENETNYIDILYDFYINEKNNIVFSLESFYKKYNNFNYLNYKHDNDINNKLNANMENENFYHTSGEINTIIYLYKNNFKFEEVKKDLIFNKKSILIYTDFEFDICNKECINLYTLAKNLDKYGEQVRIYNLYNNYILNNIFNNFCYDLNNLENKIIVYSDKIIGNPLKAPYYIKLLLNDNNKNLFLNDYKFIHKINHDDNNDNNDNNISNDKYKNIYDLIIKNNFLYYFLYENKFNINYLERNDFIINNENIQNNYINLSFFELNPNIKNFKKERKKYCHNSHDKINIRYKSFINSLKLSEDDLYQIEKNNLFNDYIEIFNNYEFFISFEPYSYLNFIALLCGCITIVYPITETSKDEWIDKTILSEYLNYKKTNNIYGISYGINDIEFAKFTIDNVEDQWKDISNFFKEQYINPFLTKIHNY
jgi:hypothetical protein